MKIVGFEVHAKDSNLCLRHRLFRPSAGDCLGERDLPCHILKQRTNCKLHWQFSKYQAISSRLPFSVSVSMFLDTPFDLARQSTGLPEHLPSYHAACAPSSLAIISASSYVCAERYSYKISHQELKKMSFISNVLRRAVPSPLSVEADSSSKAKSSTSNPAGSACLLVLSARSQRVRSSEGDRH